MLVEGFGSQTKDQFNLFGNRFSNFLFHFHQGNKNYQMSDKIKSHICLMLSVYKTIHQTVRYGRQRHHILQGFNRA